MTKRIQDKSLVIVQAIENVVQYAWAGNDIHDFETIKNHYGSDFDSKSGHLLAQLQTIVNMKANGKIHDDVRTILATIGNSPFKPMVPEVLKLCSLHSVNQASTATCERNFSCLRRVKTYLRSTMSQVRLNSLLLLDVYKDDVDKVNMLQIMQDFKCKNDLRRKTLY